MARNSRGFGVLAVAPQPEIALSWLVRLRWGAVLGQLVTIAAGAAVLGIRAGLGALLTLVAFTATTNVALERRGASARNPPRLLASVLAFDVVILTAMLAASGGAENPFRVFYFVHVALAALLLELRGTILLALLTGLCLASLHVVPVRPLAVLAPGVELVEVVRQGEWTAFTLAALFIGYFATNVSAALRDREAQVAALSRYAAKAERVAALSSFVGGAAHELGTPLATIAVVAKEMLLELERAPGLEQLSDDARLIRREVERCREILRHLGERAGDLAGEMPVRSTVAELVASVREALGDKLTERVRFDADDLELVTPTKMLVQVLVNLLRNAIDAEDQVGAVDPVVLEVRDDDAGRVAFRVLDRGVGLVGEAASRAGEPFFTTKPAGAGLGLGVYLATAFAEKLGGSLALTPREGGGTQALLVLPRNVVWALIGRA